MPLIEKTHTQRVLTCTVAFILCLLGVARTERDTPLVLEIAANKESYVVAEPIFLEVAISYIGPATGEIEVRGPILSINSGDLDVYVASPDGERVQFHRGIHSTVRAHDRVFREGDRVSATEVLTYNKNTNAVFLASPGSYSIQAEYPGLDLVSNTVTLVANAPPPSAKASAEAFQSLRLIRYMDFENVSGDLSDRLLEPALTFVGEKPENIYQYYIAAYLGCSFARSDDRQSQARSIEYLEPVLKRAGKDFAPRPTLLLDLAQSYARTGSRRKALETVIQLRQEHPTSPQAKRIKQEELDAVRRELEESGE